MNKLPHPSAPAAWRSCPLAVAVTVLLLSGCGDRSDRLTAFIHNDLRAVPGNLWRDHNDYIKHNDNIAIMLIGGGASGYVRHAHDDQIDNHFQKKGNTFSRDFTIALGAIPLAELGLAGTGYVFGALNEDNELYEVSRCMLRAQALNGVYTILFKSLAMDEGPNGGWMPAWPSGHVSISVTFASVLDEFYGPVVGIPLYALSGFVIYERMETRQHWASDVIFGAAIGYTVGKTIASKYRPEVFGMDVMPYINPQSGAIGIALAREF